MHKRDQLPLARETELMSDAIVTMTAKSFGCLGIVDGKGKLVGVVTDGDLRRHMGDALFEGAHRRHHDEESRRRLRPACWPPPRSS